MIITKPGFIEKTSRNTTDVFKGLKNSDSATDGYLLTAENLCSDAYPALTSSKPKLLYINKHPMKGPGTLGADEKIFIACDSGFIYDNVIYGGVSSGRKNFAVLDDCIAIFPDKYYFSHKTKYYYADHDSLNPFVVDYTINDSIPLISITDSHPQDAVESDKYYNTADNLIYTYSDGAWTSPEKPDLTKFYSILSTEYALMDATYTWKFASTGSATIETVSSTGGYGNDCLKLSFFRNDNPSKINLKQFRVGDKIMLFGLHVHEYVYSDGLEALSTGTEIVEIGDTYFIVKNTIGAMDLSDELSSDSEMIIIKRIIPSLDCAIAVGDRIWGAKGSVIYACAPHDILSWGEGSSNNTPVTIDSSIAGNIIGCADFGGVPVFFTENAIIKVISVYNGFKLSITPAPSLSKTNLRSIAYLGGSLYYVSDAGIMCYTGTTPKKLDFEPGVDMYDMIAGTDGIKYYLSGANHTYIYDPRNATWYTDTQAFTSFARYGSFLAGIVENAGYCFINLIGNGDLDDSGTISPSKKRAVFAPFYENTILKKTYSKLIFKLSADKGTTISVKISYNGEDFESVGNIIGKGKISVYEFPLIPAKADYIQISLEAGNLHNFTLLSITREFIVHENYN